MPPTSARDEAVAWLVDRLRFEAVLTDLQRRYDETGEPATFEAEHTTPARVAAAA